MRRFHVLALVVALCGVSGAAQARSVSRAQPDSAQVAHAKRMISALDDYDAQLARRERQLKKEMRELERKSKRR